MITKNIVVFNEDINNARLLDTWSLILASQMTYKNHQPIKKHSQIKEWTIGKSKCC